MSQPKPALSFQPQNNNRNQDQWKSDAFINIYLPKGDGGKVKLGSIGLKFNKKIEAHVIRYLQENPDNVHALLADAEIDFRMAEDDSPVDIILPPVTPVVK